MLCFSNVCLCLWLRGTLSLRIPLRPWDFESELKPIPALPSCCHFHSQTVWLRLCLQSDFTFSEKLLKVPPCEHFQHCLIFLQLLLTKVFVWLSWRFYFLAFGQKNSPMTRCPLNFRSPAVEDDSRLCISYSRRKKDILQSFDFDFSAVSPLIENNKSEIYWSFNLQFCLNFLQSFL